MVSIGRHCRKFTVTTLVLVVDFCGGRKINMGPNEGKGRDKEK